MAIRFFLSLILFSVLSASPAFAQAPSLQNAADALDRPRIGLVLGGGGAKGLSHVGVIKVLEDNQIPVDVVTGTSMGAIVGSLYASGYSAKELDHIVDTLDWGNVFNDGTSRAHETFRRKTEEFGFLTDYKITFRDGKIVLPEGIIKGQNLFLELSRLLASTRSVGNFDKLPIPLRIVATDLETGAEIVMKDGDLATAVFGSMAIPGFIPPVEREGRYLLDGGLVNNLPVDLARQMGADILIVVNVGADPKPADEIGSFIDVLRQTQILLTQNNTNMQIATLSAKDILILPDLDDFSVADFEQGRRAVQMGRAAALERQKALRALSLDDASWAEHIAARKPATQKRRTIARIDVKQDGNLSEGIVRAGLNVKAGDVFDPGQLSRDIDRLYGTGQFARITYKVNETPNGDVLQIQARTKQSADGYFKFGIDLDSNLENESSFKLGVSYTKPQINRWGGEWRTEVNIGDSIEAISELYQPIGTSQRFFIEPSILLQREKTDFFDDMDIRRGEITTLAYGASLQGGILLGRWGELRGGITRLEGDIGFTDPLLSAANLNINDASLLARFTVDTLDSLSFPTKGTLIIAEHEYHDTFLGGQFQLNQTSIDAYKPFTSGRHTLGFGTRLSGSAGRDANILGTSNLGGFLSLAGFSEDELSGQYSAMAFGTYYYRMNQRAALFDAPVFIGGSLEAGNVYQSFDDISLDDAIFAASAFAGLKSPLGPVFIGIGSNDKGNTSFYFSIGSFF